MDSHVNNPRDISNFKQLAMAPSSNAAAFGQNGTQFSGTPITTYDQFFAAQGSSWPRSSRSPALGATPTGTPPPGSIQPTSALQQQWEHLNNQVPNQNVYLSNNSHFPSNPYSSPPLDPRTAQFQNSQYASLPHQSPPNQHLQQSPPQSQPSTVHPSLASKPSNFPYNNAPSLQPKPTVTNSYQQQNGELPAATHLQGHNMPQYPSLVNYQAGIFPASDAAAGEAQASSNQYASFKAPDVKYDSVPEPPAPEPLPSNPHFMITNADRLCTATNSRVAAPYLAISKDVMELPHTKVAQLPKYDPRKTLRELRQVAISDLDLKSKLEKFDKKTSKLLSGSSTSHSGKLKPMSKTSHGADSDSDSSDSSEYSDDELEIEEEKAPLPPSRPTDPVKATEYDMIKVVWMPRSIPPQKAVLVSRIEQFSELFFKLRDRWKGSNEALKQAVEKKQTDQISSLKPKVKQNRGIVEIALQTAIQHGHPSVLDMLSENKKLLAALYGIFLDRINDKDVNGSLVIITLKFLGGLRRLTMESLELTKLLKALQAVLKRGNDEVKALVKAVLDRAAAISKKSPASTSSPRPSTSNDSGSEVATIMKGSPNGKVGLSAAKLTDAKLKPDTSNDNGSLKRPRPADNSSAVSAKRPATTVTATASSVPKRPVTTIGSKSSATAALGQTKAKTPVGPSKSMASLLAGLKKPGSSSSTPAPARPAAPTTTSQPSFSFGGMMEGILNPKANEPEKKVVEEKPKETNEEKTKRLRKEARRKLRVSWKDDHELVAIKFFTHDPDEEVGHDASSMRDAGDLGNEGRMFKQLHKDHREIIDADMDMDDEEKEESFKDDYSAPSEVDFGEIGEEQDRNYVRFGGKLTPESADRKRQEEREASTLMAVYITREDIPPRPHSPVNPLAGEHNMTVDFGIPEEKTLKRERVFKPTSTVAVPTASSVPLNISELLGVLGTNTQQAQVSQPVQTVQPPSAPAPAPTPALTHAAAPAAAPPAPLGQDLIATLQHLTAQYSTQPQPPTVSEPTFVPAQSADQVPNPLAALLGAQAYTPPPAAAPVPAPVQDSSVPDINAILAQLRGHTQPAAQAAVPTPAPAPAPVQPASAAPAAAPSVNDILASLGLTSQNPSFPGYSMPAGQPQAAPTSGPAPYENPDRKRAREEVDEDEEDEPWNKRQQNSAGRGRGGAFSKNWDPKKKTNWSYEENTKKFTKPCMFWPQGKCTKGTNCTYRHDPLT